VVAGPADLEVRPARASDEAALGALFLRSDCACYCQYWTFPGDHRDWQLRMATAPQENARGLRQGLESGELRGVLAQRDGVAVGWSRLSDASELGRLYGGRLYKGLPCFDGDRTAIMTIGCLLVDPAYRRQGVARALITAQLDYARALGARAVEAFPRGSLDVSDGEQWMGPLPIYTELGFGLAHDFPPYPVLRKHL